jgi:hypothetical protein
VPPAPMGLFRCVNVPDSRPSQTARRTGQPCIGDASEIKSLGNLLCHLVGKPGTGKPGTGTCEKMQNPDFDESGV